MSKPLPFTEDEKQDLNTEGNTYKSVITTDLTTRPGGYNLRNLENTLFVPKRRTNYGKRLLVMMGQSCGMNYLKGYEPYVYLYDTDSRTAIL